MARDLLKDRWLAVLSRTALIGCCCRFTLGILYSDMNDNGRVTFARDDLADRIGRDERTVDRHLAEAVKAGFLDHVRRGQKGQHATYAATLPDIQRDIQDDDMCRAETPLSATTDVAHIKKRATVEDEPGSATSNGQRGVTVGTDAADTLSSRQSLRATADSGTQDQGDGTRSQGAGVAQGIDSTWQPVDWLGYQGAPARNDCDVCGFGVDTIGHEVNCQVAS